MDRELKSSLMIRKDTACDFCEGTNNCRYKVVLKHKMHMCLICINKLNTQLEEQMIESYISGDIT